MSIRILGLILALAPLSAAAQSPRDALPQGIVVQGKVSVKTAPDMATLSIKLRGDGATADAASTALAAAQKSVIGGIVSLDPAASYRTGDISMREVRKGDCAETGNDVDLALSAMADAAAVDGKDKGPCRVVGHVAAIKATVEMRAVDKAGTAIGLASRLGASSASLDGFGLRDPAAARRSATAGAIADARSRAEALAIASGAKLGPVISILDSNDRDMTMYDVAEMRMLSVLPAAPELPVTIDVSPRPVETSAQILIVYALLK